MCISRDDNCVNTMCFPRQLPTLARKRTLCNDLLSPTCVIRVVLLVSYLLVSYFVMNFLRRIFSVCHSFQSMCQFGRMKGFGRCFKVENQDTWRRQNLHVAISFRQSHTRTCNLVKYHQRIVFTESCGLTQKKR